MNINLENIPVIIDEEKIKKLYNGDYKKALEDVLKNERKLAIKNVALEQNYKKQKEVLDKIKEEVEYWGYEEEYNDDKIFCRCMKKIHELLEEIE